MTKSEHIGKRDLRFNNWIRLKLPDSSLGLSVTDIDFILYNYKLHRFMLLEVKTYGKKIEFSQQQILDFLDKVFKEQKSWTYMGLHVITFYGEPCIFDSYLPIDNPIPRLCI